MREHYFLKCKELEKENKQLKERITAQSADREQLCKRIDEVRKENEQLKKEIKELRDFQETVYKVSFGRDDVDD